LFICCSHAVHLKLKIECFQITGNQNKRPDAAITVKGAKMRKLTCAIVLTGVAVLFARPASAHYLWIDPVGQQTVETGETVTVDFYAHADYDAQFMFFALNVGFDDALIDGYELEYLDMTLNSELKETGLGGFTATYKEGESVKYAGESIVWNVNGEKGPGQNIPLSAGQDLLLFSMRFSFSGPPDAVPDWTGEDVWVEWDQTWGMAVYWTNEGPFTDMGTSGTDATPLGDNGPDYGSGSAVFPVGDINHDLSVDLTDVIAALQVAVNVPPAEELYTDTEVNGDIRIGLEEAVYALQVVSGLRQ
jgi:hypothetical protein